MFSMQLSLFSFKEKLDRLHPHVWQGCFNAHESSMQQLAPYVGRMKTGMARALVLAYSEPGDTILDPFCGSGVVPYESLLVGRHAIGNDLNPYAYTITLGKCSAPASKDEALKKIVGYVDEAEKAAPYITLSDIPEWVRQFFHPRTLQETIALFRILQAHKEYFFQACLLGILHHVRPGFLSYPASHLVPYLRTKRYPPEQYPQMYEYRDVRSRIIAKVERAYRRFKPINSMLKWRILKENAMHLSLATESVDAIISSPPYYGALDYGRDNRLRLWFLGVEDYKDLEKLLTSNDKVYIPQMTKAVQEMYRVLKPGKPAVLVLGDYRRNGKKKDSAKAIVQIAQELFGDKFALEAIFDDIIPDERRTRRRTRTTVMERVLVLRKVR